VIKIVNESKTTSFMDAAFSVLNAIGAPLHSDEITRIAKRAGVLITKGKTPQQTMHAQLDKDIHKLGKLSRFIKVGPSLYTINLYTLSAAKKSSRGR
jgi:hypothetical protein